MLTLLKYCGGLSLLASSIIVSAEDVSRRGYYAGVDIGHVDLNLKFKPGGLYAGEAINYDNSALRFVNGAKFADWIAIEIMASRSSHGDTSSSLNPDRPRSQDYFTLSVGPKLFYAVNSEFKFVAKAAHQYNYYYQYDANYLEAGFRNQANDWEGDGLTLGVGGEYRLANRWFLRATYEYFSGRIKNRENYATSLKDLEAKSHFYALGIYFQI